MKNAWSNGPTGVKPADTTAFIVDLLVRIGQKPQRQRSTVSALRSNTNRYAQVGRAPCRLRGGEPDPLHSFRRGAIRPSYRLQKHVEGNECRACQCLGACKSQHGKRAQRTCFDMRSEEHTSELQSRP